VVDRGPPCGHEDEAKTTKDQGERQGQMGISGGIIKSVHWVLVLVPGQTS
jgi:hypothetical protein